MKGRRFFSILTLIVITGSLSLQAQASVDSVVLLERAEAAFKEGNELFQINPEKAEEAYRKAVNYYNSILSSGIVNGGLYYNIGNAYTRLQEYGNAILNYRKALLYSPGDKQIKYNLDYARSLQKNGFESAAENEVLHILLFGHYLIPLIWKVIILVAANLVLWLALILMRFGRSVPWAAAAAFVIVILTGVSLYVNFQADKKLHGVVTAESTIGRLGDSRSYEPAFDAPLYQGVEFSVEQKRVGWLLAKLPNGELVWIEEKDCGFVEEL